MSHEHLRPCQRCGGNVYEDMEDEYGSLRDGGSYRICRCVGCGKIHYEMLPD